jgi:hypothetical protein
MSKFDEWYEANHNKYISQGYASCYDAWNAAKNHYLDAAAKVAMDSYHHNNKISQYSTEWIYEDDIAAAIERLKEVE